MRDFLQRSLFRDFIYNGHFSKNKNGCLSSCSQETAKVFYFFLFFFVLSLSLPFRSIPRNLTAPRNLLEDFPMPHKNGEVIYDDCDPVFAFSTPPHVDFQSVDEKVPYQNRLLWNYICGRAFNYAAQEANSPSQALLYPREVGFKLPLDDGLFVYIPIWKINLDNFKTLCSRWTCKIRNFTPDIEDQFGIHNCVNLFHYAQVLAEKPTFSSESFQDLLNNLVHGSSPDGGKEPCIESHLETMKRQALLDLLYHPVQLRFIQTYQILSSK